MTYSYILKAGTDLYHGTNIDKADFQVKSQRPFWLGLTEKVASDYGQNKVCVTLGKDLKLINIMHQSFHNELVAIVYSDTNLNFVQKATLLAPLGLPSIDTQMHILDSLNGGVYTLKDDPTMKLTLDVYAPFVGNKHRYSVQTPTRNLDMELIEYIIAHFNTDKAYATYDGYIAPSYWPSCHHGGFLHPEVCVFPWNSHSEQETGESTMFTKIRILSGGKFNAKKQYGGHHEEFPSVLSNLGYKSWDDVTRPYRKMVSFITKDERIASGVEAPQCEKRRDQLVLKVVRGGVQINANKFP